MRMTKADTNGRYMICNPGRSGVYLIQGSTSMRQRACYLVHQDRSSQTTEYVFRAHVDLKKELHVPPSNQFPLLFPDCDIIANNDKFYLICLVRMKSSVLFFRQTKVEDISSVIPADCLINSLEEDVWTH